MDNSFFRTDKSQQANRIENDLQLINLGKDPFHAASIAIIFHTKKHPSAEFAQKMLGLHNMHVKLVDNKKTNESPLAKFQSFLSYTEPNELVDSITNALRTTAAKHLSSQPKQFLKILNSLIQYQEYDDDIFLPLKSNGINLQIRIIEPGKIIWKKLASDTPTNIEIWRQGKNYFIRGNSKILDYTNLKKSQNDNLHTFISLIEDVVPHLEQFNREFEKTYFEILKTLRLKVDTAELTPEMIQKFYIHLLPSNSRFIAFPQVIDARTSDSNLALKLETFASWMAEDEENKSRFETLFSVDDDKVYSSANSAA